MSTKHHKHTLAQKTNGTDKVNLLQQEAYQGPIPHPDLFAKFEDILPGAADRILTMSESEQKHRHLMEQENMKLVKKMSLLGLYFGFTLAISIILGGISLLVLGHSIEGIGLILTALAALVGSFIYKGKESSIKK